MAEESRYAVTDPAKAATFGHMHLLGDSFLDIIRQARVDLLDHARHMAEVRMKRIEHMLSMLPEGWGLAVSPWEPEPWPNHFRMKFQVRPIPPEGVAAPVPAGWEIFRSKKFGPFD